MVCYSSRAFSRTPKGHGRRHSPLDGGGSSPHAPEVLQRRRGRRCRRCYGGDDEEEGAGAAEVLRRRQGRRWRGRVRGPAASGKTMASGSLLAQARAR
jgi:hypothetical protein